MSYRCKDCVYSELAGKKNCEMNCLKHNKNVECMDTHCDDLILMPVLFLSHICYAHNMRYVKKGEYNWIDSDHRSIELLYDYGFAGMQLSDKLKKEHERRLKEYEEK